MQMSSESLAWGSRTLGNRIGWKDLRAAWSPGQGILEMQIDGQLCHFNHVQRQQLAYATIPCHGPIGGFQPQRVVDFSQSAHKKKAQSWLCATRKDPLVELNLCLFP